MYPVDIQQEGITQAQVRVLAALREAGSVQTLAALKQRTGLHDNTLRGHLDMLVRQGRVSRIAVRHGGRGRPAWGYLAREPEYAALAMALAEGLDTPSDEGDEPAAVRGGRAWGERLREQVAPDDELAPRDRVLLALEHTGFSPEADGDTVRLHSCPLLDAARAHPDVVCAAHLGLIEGVVGAPGARLRPFAAPGVCVVNLG